MKSTSVTVSILLLLVTLSSSGCMYMSGMDGNGNVVKETRDISSFNAIKVGGAFNVILAQSNTESLSIEADENLMQIIETRVKGNTLVISTRENIHDYKALNIYISFKDLEKLNISGACNLKSEGQLKFSNLKFDASGASEITMELTADKMLCNFSGASEIEFTGAASICDLEISGASGLKAYELICEDMELDISGAADAKVHATGSLEIDASGAASVKYMGSPNIDQRTSGASSIRKR
ncbi:MAG: DUF2807 domain-containing protein [Bacteroidales bacterium]|nr:DUF2807 domain-containing protein [Bacteroidales bacterium]